MAVGRTTAQACQQDQEIRKVQFRKAWLCAMAVVTSPLSLPDDLLAT